MNAVWKFPLDITDEQTIEIPAGPFKPLAVQVQKDELCLWAVVRPGALTRTVSVLVVGTGNPFQARPDLTYVGTAQQRDGRLVWHVFVGKPELIKG